ncbi:hypothetical protein Sjap_009418 [Stephania japonica]|uniref:DRBM domain-containing protein n=1 Tax=Stephania japonica TaxID=461633 RepID=A0AAP0JRX9_9MAGN
MDCDESDELQSEDVVDSLMEFLVEPLLPNRSSAGDAPPLEVQQSVAKQMHAVVLLYNYYHRKQFPQHEFMDFNSFCKVATDSKPNLLAHMKHMRKSGAQSNNLDEQFSITEKAIVDACSICSGLDASKDSPSLEDWPISKVVVFLTDEKKESCLLLMNNVTKGVWSAIEQVCNEHSGPENRVTKTSLGNDLSVDCLRKYALSAIKKETGASPKLISLLERHVVYSLSEEKMAACFYIMKLNKTFDPNTSQVPIVDAIDSLQGPLVKGNDGICEVTRVVEYFHLLPYASIVSQWYSRRMFIQESQIVLKEEADVDVDVPPTKDETSPKESVDNLDRSRANCQFAHIVNMLTSSNSKEKVKRKRNNSDYIVTDANRGRQTKGKSDVYNNDLIADLLRKYEEKTSGNMESCPKASAGGINATTKCEDITEKMKGEANGNCGRDVGTYTGFPPGFGKKPLIENDSPVAKSPLADKSCNDNYTDVCNSGSCFGKVQGDRQLALSQSYCQNCIRSEAERVLKQNEMSQSSIEILMKRRSILSHQLRQHLDELARLETNLQTISSESVIRGCSMPSAVEAANIPIEGRSPCEERYMPQRFKKRKLSEAILHMNTCQASLELENICSDNLWMLPQYTVVPSDGGFTANVILQGPDFKCSESGKVRRNPREGMESAAGCLLNKLRNMASKEH